MIERDSGRDLESLRKPQNQKDLDRFGKTQKDLIRLRNFQKSPKMFRETLKESLHIRFGQIYIIYV